MSAQKTEAKVTKIERSPAEYYAPHKVNNTGHKIINIEKKPKVTEWVKEPVQGSSKQVFRTDKDAIKVKSDREIFIELIMPFLVNGKKVLKSITKKVLSGALSHTKKLAFSGVAALVVGAILISVICGTCSLACKIKLGDKEIGTLPSEQIYYEILSDVKEEVLDTASVDFEPSGDLSVSKVIVGKGQFSEAKDVKERLKSTSSDMIPAWGITVDDKTVVALSSQEDALSVLDEYKKQFENGTEFVSFYSRVEVGNLFVPVQIIKTKDDALRFLNSQEEPVLLVQSSIECEGEEEIAFETETKNDASLYVGNNKIIQKGANGLKYVKYSAVKINGKETERTVISEEIIRKPIKQIESVGTKPTPSPVGTGDFAKPTSGTLTSKFGTRWNREHAGIDVGASNGTLIYAADNGRVTYSEYNSGGYGYMIKIDHGNGYETYYAHCSELLVKEGAVVGKGDPIAKVGNTGRSTGPHLHFEIRKNDEPQNPLKYVKY